MARLLTMPDMKVLTGNSMNGRHLPDQGRKSVRLITWVPVAGRVTTAATGQHPSASPRRPALRAVRSCRQPWCAVSGPAPCARRRASRSTLI